MGYSLRFHEKFVAALSGMSEREQDALRKRLNRAAERGVRAFDSFARTETTMHPPISARVSFGKYSQKITLAVSGRVPTLRYVRVTPDVETTGRNRQPITVTGWTNKVVQVPRGFIWFGNYYTVQKRNYVFQRRENAVRAFDSARRYLIERDALPTPAELLARCKNEVTMAVLEVLYERGN